MQLTWNLFFVAAAFEPFKLFRGKFMQRFWGITRRNGIATSKGGGGYAPSRSAAHLQSKYLLYKLEEHFEWHLGCLSSEDREGEICLFWTSEAINWLLNHSPQGNAGCSPGWEYSICELTWIMHGVLNQSFSSIIRLRWWFNGAKTEYKNKNQSECIINS